MFWLVVAFIAGLVGSSVIRRGRQRLLPGQRNNKKPKQLGSGQDDELASFAEANGWRLFLGPSPEIRGEAAKLFALAGPPSLDALYAHAASAPKHVPRGQVDGSRWNRDYYVVEYDLNERWQISSLLRRDTADGPQTVLGAKASGGVTVVIACIATSATVHHFGLDIVGWDSQLHAEGDKPEGVEFDEVLSGFSAPLRLRFGEGTLLLRIPGMLTPHFAETMIERLEMVRDVLPRRPGDQRL